MELTMADLMAEIDKSMSKIYKKDIKTAKVIAVEENGIVAHIGYHLDAIIPWNEYSYDDFNKEDVKIGDEFPVSVMKVDEPEARVIVSKKRAETEKAIEAIEKMYKDEEQLSVKIANVTKGGLITNIKGMRAFIPNSQITDTYVEDLKTYVGKTMEVKIIQFEPKNKRLVLSGKDIAKETRLKKRKDRLAEIEIGEKYKGKVVKLMPYGVFVDLDGVEGLVHNSDLTWERIKHPQEVLKEGDIVEATILSINENKIALRIKDIDHDPWQIATTNLEEGDIVEAKIVKFMSFGAFAKINDGVEGLIHISQISPKRIAKPEDALQIDQVVEAKITKIDRKDKKIGLSIIEAIGAMTEDMKQYVNGDNVK
ncbi:30S ribosomal protein S1 [Candidatus Epulonipiscium fishelsonii]|uniref:30S ribosomal protein S1 n=1 Tax=Candidatus Epulonipiscium fishelsonii TaxID=77094 RepID=A0ACC8XHL3_9FIRM|nr:30S ribosomal protein S1 [Epulopiscium sp. SCG-D08WGA-EpuloA1]OON96398.1 MAG: 30S ribosomal protein S1 [Epulopiscium sp. AS2M-Bin002]